MPESFFEEGFLQRLERLALVARHASAGHMQGERRSPKRGQSVEFADFRPYVAGDDFRRIDWNAYARLERFFIKLFVEEEDLTVHLLVDSSRSMRWGEPGKLWYATRIAGALGYIALAGLDRVTVTSPGGGQGQNNGSDYFAPHRGKRQALALFQFLEALNNEKDNGASAPFNPELALRAYAGTRASLGTSPGSLVLISDLMDDGWTEGLRALASRGFEITVIHVLSPDEIDPQMDGDLKLIDSEDSSNVEITADYDLLARYRKSVEAWRVELNRFCSARSILYVPLSTATPLETILFSLLERQGVLR
jgi:uncharacterized protein (DUF58 family)